MNAGRRAGLGRGRQALRTGGSRAPVPTSRGARIARAIRRVPRDPWVSDHLTGGGSRDDPTGQAAGPHGSDPVSPRDAANDVPTRHNWRDARVHDIALNERPDSAPEGVHDAAPKDVPTLRPPGPGRPRSPVKTRVRSDSQTGLTPTRTGYETPATDLRCGCRPTVKADLTTRPRRRP